jgi:hypothetical protein
VARRFLFDRHVSLVLVEGAHMTSYRQAEGPFSAHVHIVHVCTCAKCARVRLYTQAVCASVGGVVRQYGWPVLGDMIRHGALPWDAAAEVLRRPAPVWGRVRWQFARLAVEAMARGEMVAAAMTLASAEGLTMEAWIGRAQATEVAEMVGERTVVESTGEVVSS